MRPAGVRTVARQEFRLRIRAGRWRWLLAAWFVVLVVFTVLLRAGLAATGAAAEATRGATMYGGLMLFVLALALLVVPALSAQSINGDRERGTLAVLQVTRLSAPEIALGKFTAAWGTALVFLALTAPLVLWCVAEGGVSLARVVAVTAVVGLLLGVVCAVALALSSLLARSSTSSLLSYLSVFTLTVGTAVLFGLATAVTTETVQVHSGRDAVYTTTVAHTDQTWWLLAPNPFVVLADAAPSAEPRRVTPSGGRVVRGTPSLDPLAEIGEAVRDARQGPDVPSGVFAVDGAPPEPAEPGRVWPYGLAFDLLLAAGALWVTTRRLRTPARSLPKGMRVA